ncbi:protein tumorous imaginal discs, mitochondrial-like [Varroa jacobsoni]|uniref:Uncharacterized protein n=1 Tax=Varroa destructor TaxID=109461 RepID=A0A7M7L3P2_VARDE|nr:protein tumorous imaginal discs, mitochondrial-like [Varroa destructor]XP_022707073.1 protein tumorous imaginal discs, mitochondrial-like [Varroa jacobsoni]
MLLRPLLRRASQSLGTKTSGSVVTSYSASVAPRGVSWCSDPCFTASSSRSFHLSSILEKRDYYDVLGVPRNASSKDIKKAYYQLAKKYHPDTNKGDKDAAKKFTEVSEAYEVLSDESKRQQYDQFGTASMGSTGFGAGSGGPGAGFGGADRGQQQYTYQSHIDPEELFRKIFGDFAGGQGGNKNGFDPFGAEESQFGFGQAQEVIVNLTFEEAARGINKEMQINIVDTCPKCSGSRAELGTKSQPCQFCHGTGMETISTGPFVMRSTCRKCGGTRVFIPHKCTECAGKGQTVQRKKVTCPIPAGVEDGQTIRMVVGNKELFVTLRVARSRQFRRDGADLHSEVPISITQAVLGGTVNVHGIYEDVRLRIQPGTSSHTKIRISGKGLRRVNTSGCGDHYVNIKIEVPTSLTPEMKALMQAFAEVDKHSNKYGTVGSNQGSPKDGSKPEAETGQKMKEDGKDDDGILSKIKKAIFE